MNTTKLTQGKTPEEIQAIANNWARRYFNMVSAIPKNGQTPVNRRRRLKLLDEMWSRCNSMGCFS